MVRRTCGYVAVVLAALLNQGQSWAPTRLAKAHASKIFLWPHEAQAVRAGTLRAAKGTKNINSGAKKQDKEKADEATPTPPAAPPILERLVDEGARERAPAKLINQAFKVRRPIGAPQPSSPPPTIGIATLPRSPPCAARRRHGRLRDRVPFSWGR